MKVLGISDGCDLYTGFGTQSLIVLKGFLERGIEVEQLGWFKHETIIHRGIKIHPVVEYGDLDKVIHHCNRFKPDIIWSLGDLHMVQYLLGAPEEIRKRWIHWLPVDAEPFPYMMKPALESVPNLVLMSEFAHEMCKPHLSNLVAYIPHGLDPNVFKPIQNRDLARKKYQVADKFMVLLVAKNQWRKNLDLAVEAFARFAKGKKDVLLVLHTQPSAVPKLRGWFISNLIKMNADDYDSDLRSKIKISFKQMPESQLNLEYNLSNLFFLTSAGEGFGIPSIEAQMAGIPILVPDFTTGKEFVLPDGKEENRTGDLIRIATYQIQGDAGVKRALIDTKDAATKLETFYRSWKMDKTLLLRYGENGRRNSIKKYHYQNVIDLWHKAIVDLYSRIKNEPYKLQTYTETASFDVSKPIQLEEI